MIEFFRRLWSEIRAEINPAPPSDPRPSWLAAQDPFEAHQVRCIRCRLGRTFCDEGARLFIQTLEKDKGRQA